MVRTCEAESGPKCCMEHTSGQILKMGEILLQRKPDKRSFVVIVGAVSLAIPEALLDR